MDHFRQSRSIVNFGDFAASPRLGQKNTAEATRKSADARRGKTLGADARKRMSHAQIERHKISIHPRQGKKHSADSIEKMRQAHTGKKQSAETIEKRSAALMGHPVSERTRNLLSQKMKIAKLGNQSNAKSFPKLINMQTGQIAHGNNLARFCRKMGLSIHCMRNLISGKQKTHRGWKLHAT